MTINLLIRIAKYFPGGLYLDTLPPAVCVWPLEVITHKMINFIGKKNFYYCFQFLHQNF